MRKKLLKDIVIPAGTIFDDAPTHTTRAEGTIDCVFGLTDNTSGTVEYFIGDDSELLEEWFEDAPPAAQE